MGCVQGTKYRLSLERARKAEHKRCRSTKKHDSSVAAFGCNNKRICQEDGEAWFQ